MEEKSLKNNFLYNTLFILISIGYPLIVTPYLSRVLKADGIGTVDYAISIVNFFLVFASLGIPNYGVREIAKCREKKEDLYKTFIELLIINILSSVICSVIYVIFVLNCSSLFPYRSILLMLGLLIIFNSFQISWFYQGLTEYRIITIRSFVVKMIMLISILLIVKTREDYSKYIIIYVIAHIGENIFNIVKSREFIQRTDVSINLKGHFKPILIMLSTQLAVNIYCNLDTAMLGSIVGTRAVGYYSSAHKIVRLLSSLAASLSAVLLPRLSLLIRNEKMEDMKKLLENIMLALIFISFAFGTGVIIVSNELITLFCGDGYAPSVIVIKILGIMIPILTLGNLFGTQILLTFNAEKELMYSVILSAIVNFVMNLLLIPQFQQNGAAVASVVAELVAVCYQYIMSRKYIKIQINIIEIIKEATGILGMIIIGLTINQLIHGTLIKFVLCFLGCSVTYMLIAFLLKNEGFRYLYKLLIKKSNMTKEI